MIFKFRLGCNNLQLFSMNTSQMIVLDITGLLIMRGWWWFCSFLMVVFFFFLRKEEMDRREKKTDLARAMHGFELLHPNKPRTGACQWLVQTRASHLHSLLFVPSPVSFPVRLWKLSRRRRRSSSSTGGRRSHEIRSFSVWLVVRGMKWSWKGKASCLIFIRLRSLVKPKPSLLILITSALHLLSRYVIEY